MDMQTAIKNRIIQLRKDRYLSIYKLAAVCKIPSSSLKNILYGKSHNPSVMTIKLICDGLNITMGDFFNTAEFNSLEPEIK